MNSALPARATRRELAAAALVLAVITFIFVFLSDGQILFTRPLWTDELHTVLLAGRASPLRILSDLSHGADFGPPLLHVAVWLVRLVTGSLSLVLLRALSLLCVGGALLLVYAVLRRHVSRSASAAGVLAAASHDLVVAHSFEARFYGPWLLCIAFAAWTLGLPSTRRRSVLVAVASVLVVTVHWYGIVTLALLCAGAVATFGRRWRDALRCIAPAGAGIVALAACIPLAVGQRHALTVNTWVPEFTFVQLGALARMFWTAMIPALAAAIFVVATLRWAWRGDVQPVTRTVVPVLRDPAVVGLTALGLMPLALAAMSLAGQPSMWPRYGIAAALAWAPFVALAVELMGPIAARAFAVVALAAWFVAFSHETQYKRAYAIGVARNLDGSRQARAAGQPVVFESMHALYGVASAAWPARDSVMFLELPDSTLDAMFPRGGRFDAVNKGFRVERDVARVHARRFGFPVLAPQRALDTTARFVLVASDQNLPAGFRGIEGIIRVVFPHHRMALAAPGFYVLERAAGPAH